MAKTTKVQKMFYFDTVLDQDLLTALEPYFQRKRGNDKGLQLMRAGLHGVHGVQQPALVQQALPIAPPVPPVNKTVAARAATPKASTEQDRLQALREQAQKDFS